MRAADSQCPSAKVTRLPSCMGHGKPPTLEEATPNLWAVSRVSPSGCVAERRGSWCRWITGGGHCVEPFQPSGITTETGLSGQWLRRGSEGASVGRGPFTQRELVTVSGIRLDNTKRAGPPIAFLYRTLEPPNVRTVLVSYREASTGKVGRRNGAAPGEVSFSTNVLHYSPHRPHHGPEIPGFR